MNLHPNQQFVEALRRAERVLLVCPENTNFDALTSALALAEILRQMKKTTEVVQSNFAVPTELKFLPEIKQVRPRLGAVRQLTVKITAPLGITNYEHTLNDARTELVVKITPAVGVLPESCVRAETSAPRFDLVVVVGATNFTALGELYSANAALFQETPILNLDCSPRNEFFGHINLVDITRASVAEVVVSFLPLLAEVVFNEKLADLLLTGIIAATRNFKTAGVGALTLQTASQLMANGAGREKIVSQLFEQRSVNTLRLWGVALTHTQNDRDLPLVWSTLTHDELARHSADEKDLMALLDELMCASPAAKIWVIAFENDNGAVGILLEAQKPYQVADLIGGWSTARALTPARVFFNLPGLPLMDAVARVVNVLRSKMRE